MLVSLLVFASSKSFSQDQLPLVNSSQLIKEGISLHDAGKYREAIEVYDRITTADSNYVLALYEKALSCQADSLFEQGLMSCELALKQSSDRGREPELYSLYGNITDNMGQHERALAIYDSAITLYPAYSTLYVNKIITLINTRQYDEAEKVLKQALLQDPYSPSLHYYNGMLSINKGRIVPAILSYVSYLLILPEGKNRGKVINLLSSIANNEDAVTQLINNRTEETPANFQEIEQLLASKIALDNGYEQLVAINDPICRQLQMVLEKLEYDQNDQDFTMQYYVPLYQKIFTDQQFEPLINHIFSGIDLDEIKSYQKKSKKAIQQFVISTTNYLNLVRSTRQLDASKRDQATEQYHFEDGKLYGFGVLKNDLNIGKWKFYYTSGNLKAVGQYDDSGKKHGLWKYYYYNGKSEGEENLVNGLLDGPVMYNYKNGKPSMKGAYRAGEKIGESTRYYKTGGVNVIEVYERGVITGTRKIYSPSGSLNGVEQYKDGELHGPFIIYYLNGHKEKEGNMLNGKLSGAYVYYHENGVKAIEGQYENGVSVGPWKNYHENGKIKSTQTYVNDLIEGEYTEYYDNGQLFTKYQNKKGKANGEASYFDKDGKLFSILLFDNDKIKWAKYFDKTGKQISFSETKNKQLTLVVFTPDGRKKSETLYNEKGNIEGKRTFFYTSGTLKETDDYRDGNLEGLSVDYYPNGAKKYETNYQEGTRDGYFTSYFNHGGKSQEGWYINDQAQGTWIDYDSKSTVIKRSEYLNDKLHGVSTSYWPNGKKQSETYYEDGEMSKIVQYDTLGNISNTASLSDGNGTITLLYVNGKKQFEANYINNQPVGEWAEYFFDGKIKSLKYYRHGLQDSICREYYHNGKIKTEGQYTSGNKTGEWKDYSKVGTLTGKATYVNGELDGKRFYYYENGKINTETEYLNGERNGIFKRFDDSGLLMIQVNYKAGSIASYTYHDKNNNLVPEIPLIGGNGKVVGYFANGKMSVEFELADDELNNNDNRYYSNGQISLESRENFGNTEGELKYYYADGKLKSVSNYLHNEQEGPFKEYHANGKVKAEGQGMRGMLYGQYKIYDEKGKLTETQIYYFDQLLEVHK
jgi:uncharacterized protein